MAINFSLELGISRRGVVLVVDDFTIRFPFPKFIRGDLKNNVIVIDRGPRPTEVTMEAFRVLTQESRWRDGEQPREYYVHPVTYVMQNKGRPWTKQRVRHIELYSLKRLNGHPIIDAYLASTVSNDLMRDPYIGRALMLEYEEKNYRGVKH